MAYEGFVDYWARRISRHPIGSAERAASIKRCMEALDAEIGSRHAPERAEITERIHTEIVALRRAERFMDGYDDPWGPTGRYGGKLVNWMVQSRQAVKTARLATMYGTSPIEQILIDPLFKRTNPEGEKMEKIDWHKPLRSRVPGDPKAYTYKSGKQRVVWIGDFVYPVDEQGRAAADVSYGRNWVRKGSQIVENAPEEKFFVGLYRHIGTSNYFLEDGGVMKTRERVQLAECPNQWIVDTRKSAEPPKAIEHDPEDYATVWFDTYDDAPKASGYAMTKSEAEAVVSEPGEQVVRMRVTPPPVDTARYIQLYRRAGTDGPWRINAFPGARQEYTWEEADKKNGYHEYVNVKVRD